MVKHSRKILVVGQPSTSFLIYTFIQKLEQRVEDAKTVRLGDKVTCPVCRTEFSKATHHDIFCSPGCEDVTKPIPLDN